VIQTPEQQFYLSKLSGYHYEIQYRPGKFNVVADALSRSQGAENSDLMFLSVPKFIFLYELRKE